MTWTARAGDAAQMRERGAEVAQVLRAGDIVVLDGPLGAGKTTFVQGLGAALGVRGNVTSPTFVIARVHRGPRVHLVHVDAYRLAGALEVDDLDLDADVAESVTVIEWGSGKVEELGADRLVVQIARDDDPGQAGSPTAPVPADVLAQDPGDAASGARVVQVTGVGERWSDLRL
jgi:tRNA threonylcarbamoyladenosine biosynthesis protein TsaE